MADRQIEIVNRLQSAMLGDFAAVAKLPEGDQSVISMGVIVGIARGLSFRTNPQDPGNPSIALTGVFEGIPTDPNAAVIRSTACYLPKTVHDLVVARVRGEDGGETPAMPARGQKIDVVGNEVQICFAIGAKKSKVAGGAGYEFVTKMLAEPSGVDPLAELKDKMQALLPKPAEPSTAEVQTLKTGTGKRK